MFKSTPKQRAASRANSQQSTGPRTTAGKAVSRFNALKHGIFAVHQIMFEETPEDLAELAAEYHELYNPVDSHERALVDSLVHNEWRLRRMRRVEAGLWDRARDLFIVKNLDTTVTCTSAEAFATDSATFERLQRVANACDRAYHCAHRELVARAQGRPQPEAKPAPAPQPAQSKPAFPPSASFRTNPQTPAPAAPKPPAAAPAPPDAAPFAQPDPAATPADSQPSTVDRDPKPPEAA
jgi:hypothetical protein